MLDDGRSVHKKLVIAGLMLGVFMAAIESTVVATAMPKATASLGGAQMYSWIFTGYLLTATVSGPLWGRISDFRGRKSLYMLGVFFFIVGSALSGTSATMPQLVVFRAVQGLGAGALFIMTFTIVGDIFRLEERARAVGYTTSVWAVASILGPPTGGIIADLLNWRWVFYINIPFGLAAMIVLWKYLNESQKRERGNPNILGGILFAVGSTATLVFLNGYLTVGEWSFLFLAAGLISLLLWFQVERRSDSPIIPLHLMKVPIVRTAVWGNLLAGLAFFGSIAYIPILLQWVIGLSATEAGLILIPFSIFWVISANITSRILVRLGTKPITIAGGLSLTLGMSILSFAGPSVLAVLTAGCLTGAGMGAIVPVLLISSQTLVKRQVLGAVTSIQTFMRLFGGAIGVAVMWIPISMTGISIDVTSGAANLVLDMVTRLALADSLTQAFRIGLFAAALSLPLYLLLPRIKLQDNEDR